jgi:hypothetical protein
VSALRLDRVIENLGRASDADWAPKDSAGQKILLEQEPFKMYARSSATRFMEAELDKLA